MAEVNFGKVFGTLAKETAKPCEGEDLGYADETCEAEGTHSVKVYGSPDRWNLCEECYEVGKAVSADYR